MKIVNKDCPICLELAERTGPLTTAAVQSMFNVLKPINTCGHLPSHIALFNIMDSVIELLAVVVEADIDVLTDDAAGAGNQGEAEKMRKHMGAALFEAVIESMSEHFPGINIQAVAVENDDQAQNLKLAIEAFKDGKLNDLLNTHRVKK